MIFYFRDKRISQIDPDLEFDEALHKYRYKGKTVPSVSDILRPYKDFSMVSESSLQACQGFGKKLHELFFLLDIDDLDPASIDPLFEPYVAGYTRYKQENGLDVNNMLAEVSLGDDRYAGTLDRLFALPKVDLLLDFKSGQANRASGVQLAAYGSQLIKHGITSVNRLRMAELTFTSDGTAVARPIHYAFHLNVFQSLLVGYNFFKS